MKKPVFVLVFLLMLTIPFAEGAAHRLDGVYKINGIRKSKIKKISGQYEAYTATISGVDVNHVLYGMSGTPYNNQDLDDIIGNSTLYQMNAFRIAFSPEDGASRPYNATQIQYLLDNSDLIIVVDRNHYTGEAVNWTSVEEDIFTDVLEVWPNNSRIIPEIVNEYPNGNFDGQDLWEHIDPILDSIAAAHYTNPILCNKHSVANDWADGVAMSTPLDFHGKHGYMNNAFDPANGTQSLGWLQGLHEDAMNADAVPLVPTEVGADTGGATQFNQTKVDALRDFIIWGRGLDIGCFIWMNKFATSPTNHLNTYLSFNLFEGL
ncbi:cellulase family glycosylhydrolase [Thermoproteota archaeon]